MASDPGGNFASDEHRRVIAALPGPGDDPRDGDDLLAYVNRDDQIDFDFDELEEILADLEADGDVTQLKNGWKATKAGYAALTGPIAEDGGRAHGN